MAPILIDTCAAIWLSSDARVSAAAMSALRAAVVEAVPIYVSPISAWEIGLLVARRRVDIRITPDAWFTNLLDIPGVTLADLLPSWLIASSFLPGEPPNDPADRIIAATARDLGATLLTRDRKLLDYARQGHLSALAC